MIYQFSNLAGAARRGATYCHLHWAKGRLSLCPWVLGLCLGAHYQMGPPPLLFTKWAPLPCYASQSEMATCSIKIMFARGPAGVTVHTCLKWGPNSCCLPRAPIVLNPALGLIHSSYNVSCSNVILVSDTIHLPCFFHTYL